MSKNQIDKLMLNKKNIVEDKNEKKLNYYDIESFSNLGLDNSIEQYETIFEGFENQNSSRFLEQFYNVNSFQNNLQNNIQFEHFSDSIQYNNIDQTFNEAFENLEKFDIQNGNGLEGFSFIDYNQNKEICEDGFCGIPFYKTYSQYENLHDYKSNFGFYAPTIKHSSKSKYNKKQLPPMPPTKRAIDAPGIVEQKFGTFAPVEKVIKEKEVPKIIPTLAKLPTGKQIQLPQVDLIKKNSIKKNKKLDKEKKEPSFKPLSKYIKKVNKITYTPSKPSFQN